jgi:hypothetical protein
MVLPVKSPMRFRYPRSFTHIVGLFYSYSRSLIPSVDGVAGEVTHEVPVPAQGAPHVVVQLAVHWFRVSGLGFRMMRLRA